MARQIIILESLSPAHGPTDAWGYRYAFWLAVPTARQTFLANAAAKSVVQTATAAEVTAIQNGFVKEEVSSFSVASTVTTAQVEAQLQTAFAARQAQINSATENYWVNYGSAFDGTAWTIVTVA